MQRAYHQPRPPIRHPANRQSDGNAVAHHQNAGTQIRDAVFENLSQQALYGKDPETRSAAVKQLGVSHDARAIPALLRAFRADVEPSLQYEAAEAACKCLKHIEPKTVTPTIRAAAIALAEAALKSKNERAIEDLNDSAVTPHLITARSRKLLLRAALTADSFSRKATCCEAIERLLGPEGFAEIAKLLNTRFSWRHGWQGLEDKKRILDLVSVSSSVECKLACLPSLIKFARAASPYYGGFDSCLSDELRHSLPATATGLIVSLPIADSYGALFQIMDTESCTVQSYVEKGLVAAARDGYPVASHLVGRFHAGRDLSDQWIHSAATILVEIGDPHAADMCLAAIERTNKRILISGRTHRVCVGLGKAYPDISPIHYRRLSQLLADGTEQQRTAVIEAARHSDHIAYRLRNSLVRAVSTNLTGPQLSAISEALVRADGIEAIPHLKNQAARPDLEGKNSVVANAIDVLEGRRSRSEFLFYA